MSIRVAMVEDSPEIRHGLALIMYHSPDCELVTACATGEEALQTLPRLQPDVILLDSQTV